MEQLWHRVQRPLTDREAAVAELLAQGLGTAAIARKLSLSPHTIAAHIAKMLRNLNASNRTELVARLYADEILASGEWPPRATAACVQPSRDAISARPGPSSLAHHADGAATSGSRQSQVSAEAADS